MKKVISLIFFIVFFIGYGQLGLLKAAENPNNIELLFHTGKDCDEFFKRTIFRKITKERYETYSFRKSLGSVIFSLAELIAIYDATEGFLVKAEIIKGGENYDYGFLFTRCEPKELKLPPLPDQR